MAGEVGIEPTNAGIRIQCLTTWRLPINYELLSRKVFTERLSSPYLKNSQLTPVNMAGEVGIEPTNAEIKTQCLTTWRLPII